MTFQLKRVYEPPAADDGKRILVDRLWPRGLAKEAAAIDCWLREIAPTPELRKWFCHRLDRFEEFRLLYRELLSHNPEHLQAVDQLLTWADVSTVTLLYAAKDTTCNHAVVLLEHLKDQVFE